jgi:hypothetical protein
MKYEEIGVNYNSDSNPDKKILTHINREGLLEKVKNAEAKLKNPYQEAYLWLKGEYLDI